MHRAELIAKDITVSSVEASELTVDDLSKFLDDLFGLHRERFWQAKEFMNFLDDNVVKSPLAHIHFELMDAKVSMNRLAECRVYLTTSL